jgi:hypothetical protein
MITEKNYLCCIIEINKEYLILELENHVIKKQDL